MHGGILYLLKEINVKNVIIGKQFLNSANLNEFTNIVNEKKINIFIVEAGEKINIEKNLYIDVLWPGENLISENPLNNNSLVCKLNYNNFSMLFTGDIERIAEEKIIKKLNKKILKADVLKVAHHGSKTSSIQEFIEMVQPQIALIGVGANNTFGHPNENVVERLEKLGTKIYRTDEMGEINIIVNNKCVVKSFK